MIIFIKRNLVDKTGLDPVSRCTVSSKLKKVNMNQIETDILYYV